MTMLHKVLIIFAFLFLSITCVGQSITWFRTYGEPGPYHEEGRAVVQTPDNGFILVGQSPPFGLRGIRLNAYGDTLWYRIFPGFSPNDIIKTSDNNYVFIGYSYVTKIDINGNIIFSRGPFNSNVILLDVIELNDGGFIISGRKDTLGILSKPYLLKLDANGILIWQRTYNTNIYDGFFGDVNLAFDNNYLLAGSYSDNPDSVIPKMFVIKTDTHGTPLFFNGYDTLSYHYPGLIIQTGSNSFIVGGGSLEPFLTKIDSSGIIQWYRNFLPIALRNYSTTNTFDNGYAFTGWWDTAGTEIEHHVFLLKTDSNGYEQLRKVYLFAPNDYDYGMCLKQTSDSGYIISGTRGNDNNGNGIIDMLAIKTDKFGNTRIIGIQPINSETPESFKLYQNYPNPFNSTTIIRFDIVKRSNVKIVLYDVLGRGIKKLLENNLQAGEYEINFDASTFASGLYIYKIETGDFSDTKKMVLLK